MNYARISRTDDEPYDDEGDFVAARRDALLSERRKLREYVRDALADALSDDGDDYFATKLAEFVIAHEAAGKKGPDAEISGKLLAGFTLHKAIEHLITERLERDAETDAAHEWATRQTGPEDA